MALPFQIRGKLRLPAICAPMKDVSCPALVIEAAKAGIMAALPAHNASGLDEFEAWLDEISRALDAHRQVGGLVGPLAVNVAHINSPSDEARFARACQRAGVEIFISAFGNPEALIRRAHDFGMLAFHDVTTVRFAEKALGAGADGLIAIGAGGGGHSGTISHLGLIPEIRQMTDKTLVMAGAVGTGAAIRAAEILGADLAYLGTRFVATRESAANEAYKQAIVAGSIADLIYTATPTGIPANWLKSGLRRLGLDPDALPERITAHGAAHYGADVRPWQDIGSAGHGIGLIVDIPSVAELVDRLADEYAQACRIPEFSGASRPS